MPLTDDIVVLSIFARAVLPLDPKERRGLLQGWGFRCCCERCEEETRETIRLATRRTQNEENALRVLQRLEQIMDLGRR